MSKRLLASLALVLALILAADVLSLGLSRGLVGFAPNLAAQLRPFSTEPVDAIARQRLAAGDAASAHALATASLSREPMDANTLGILGLAQAAGSQPQAALRTMRLAGALSWRDEATQTWLLRNSITTGQVDDAVLRADSLLRRTRDSGSSPVSAMLIAAAELVPQFQSALAARLALSPNWRARFLIQLGQAPGAAAAARSVLGDLRTGPTPPTAQEAAALVASEVQRHQFAQARLDWLALAPHRGGLPNAAITDGQFAGVSDGTDFTWVLESGVGATLDRVAATDLGRGQQALSVLYDGYSTTDMASQLLTLPPGPHTLTWRERIDEGDGRFLAWTIACGAGGATLAQVTGQAPQLGVWRTRQLSFTVPATGCEGQWLRLVGVPGDQRGTNSALYTDFAV